MQCNGMKLNINLYSLQEISMNHLLFPYYYNNDGLVLHLFERCYYFIQFVLQQSERNNVLIICKAFIHARKYALSHVQQYFHILPDNKEKLIAVRTTIKKISWVSFVVFDG